MEGCVLKYTKKLRACSALSGVSELEALLTEIETALSSSQDSKNGSADAYFRVFQAALDSKRPPLMEIALSAIHILINRGYLHGYGSLYVGSQVDKQRGNAVDNKTGASVDPEQIQENDRKQPIRERKVSVTKKANLTRTDMDHMIEQVSRCSEINDDGVHLQTIKVLLTAVTSVSCEVHEATLLLAIQACFHIHLVSRNVVNKVTAKAALTQMVSSINMDLEVADGKIEYDIGDLETETSGEVNGDVVFPSIAFKDSYLVFRALCKLSMKGLYDDSDLAHATRIPQSSGSELDVNAVAVQNKILSLELILHILEKCGNMFQNYDKIIDAIRKYLCISLLGNCTSQVTQVAALSLRVFVALMERFKNHLKTEFEIFFTSILFKILDSGNSTFEHKIRVMEVFHKISANQDTLVEFFINYDCDLDTSDVFRHIVASFARIAKNPVAAKSKSTVNQEGDKAAVKKMGISGLVLILKSLLAAKGLSIESKLVAGEDDSAAITEDTESSKSPKASEEVSPPMNAVDAFDRKQKKQEQIEIGIIKFAMSPKKGLDYLINVGYLENTPLAVARFLLYEDRLDKVQIGDYIGREPEYCGGFCLEVLHEYVEQLDFTKMPFDLAIRFFLRGFRLPGEAQKIDRIMEKFAERYYLQNQSEFASADMAFILAFSTIMLQTNLHNPAIKEEKKMTKAQFLKQNTGITSDGELSHELLGDIYDRISQEPISMTEEKKNDNDKVAEASGFGVGFQTSDETRRMDAFNDERKEMMRKGESLFKKKSRKTNAFVTSSSANNEAYVRPMFEAAWAPIMAALSHIFEAEDDPAMIEQCLMGFKCATRLACRLDLPVVRATYINALAKCTALDLPRKMKPKNTDSVKIVIEIAHTEREHLGESWLELLNCISQMARLLQFEGSVADDVFTNNFSERGGVPRSSAASRGGQSHQNESGLFASIFGSKDPQDPLDPLKELEESNFEQVMHQTNLADIDRIFHTSHKLSAESVVHFVRALCAVSIQEINSFSSIDVQSSSGTPRIFSLQKLVEVADFNMHSRSRLQWGAMWNLLAEHFTKVGTHENHLLGMFAIDSLRQLSLKFLQKEELSNFNFQRVFLKPFEVIMVRSPSIETKELILHCVETMILACSKNIRSGWRSIFAIFSVCANQESVEIATMALNVIEKLMSNRFDVIFQDFVEVVNCFVVYSNSRHEKLSIQAIDHLAFCADKLAADGGTERFSKGASSGEDAAVFRLWWPLLLGLSTGVGDSRVEIRIKAFNTLHQILKSHGSAFSVDAWKMIFKGILFPTMDSAKTDLANQVKSAHPTENPFLVKNSSSWIDTVGLKVLNVCLEFFMQLEPLSEKLSVLPDLLHMLESCINQETEVLARLGMTTLGDMILYLGKMDEPTSDRICSYICDIITRNLCTNFGPAGRLQYSEDYPVTVQRAYQCPVQARRSSQCEEKVSTIYGDGILTHYAEPAADGDIPPRAVVQLPWGLLYGRSQNMENPSQQTSRTVSAQVWDEVSRSAMTSMVISLDIMHILKAVFDTEDQNNRDCGATANHLEKLLKAVEASHWYARSFNEDARLSTALQSMNFMHFKSNPGRPPNVLEQEIRTANMILVIAHKLNQMSSGKASKRSEKWIRRYTDIVILRYAELDASLHSNTPLEEDLINAYKPTVMETLTRLTRMSEAKLEIYESWVVPLITKLILCSDFEIRYTVADLLSKIAHKNNDGSSETTSPATSPLR